MADRFDILGRPPMRRPVQAVDADPLPPIEDDPAFRPVRGLTMPRRAMFSAGGRMMTPTGARGAQRKSSGLSPLPKPHPKKGPST
jgi:hypothetical protein